MKSVAVLVGCLTMTLFSSAALAGYPVSPVNQECGHKITQAVTQYALDNGYIKTPATNGFLHIKNKLPGHVLYYSILKGFTTDLKNNGGQTCTNLYFQFSMNLHYPNTNAICDFQIIDSKPFCY